MNSEDVLKFLKEIGWKFDEENYPYRKLRYKKGAPISWRSYINQEDLIEVCQQFYLRGKHDAEIETSKEEWI